MLSVTYEAVDDLAPGQLASVHEDRGRLHIRLAGQARLSDVVPQLNAEVDQLLACGNWFQLWRDEIVSRSTPRTPIRVEYLLSSLIAGTTVAVEEKGLIQFHIDPSLETVQAAASINAAVQNLLEGGRWFQLYAGEVVDISPEPHKV